MKYFVTFSVSTTPPVGNESASPSSPTMQHVLDTFLDDTFPGKLADIINQCVSRYAVLHYY